MPTNNLVFYLSYASFRGTRLLAWLLVLVSLSVAFACIVLSLRLWSTYTHVFTPYLKWQDALLATLCYLSIILIGASVMVMRFYYAVKAGFHQGMIIQKDSSTLVVRDLSSKNLISIYRAIGTILWCFIAALVGLVPVILLGWTIHLPHPALVMLCTGVAILLSLAGLVVTLISTAFIFIGWMGCVSFCRSLGAPQTYQLNRQTTMRLDDMVLSITYPHQAEAVLDLRLLEPEEQYHILSLLHTYYPRGEYFWHPDTGDEIENVSEEVDYFTMLV
jgi:hypothetical protein